MSLYALTPHFGASLPPCNTSRLATQIIFFNSAAPPPAARRCSTCRNPAAASRASYPRCRRPGTRPWISP
jgi:hypothetical protein